MNQHCEQLDINSNATSILIIVETLIWNKNICLEY